MSLLVLAELFMAFIVGMTIFSIGIFLLEQPVTILVVLGLAVFVFGGYGMVLWSKRIFDKLKIKE